MDEALRFVSGGKRRSPWHLRGDLLQFMACPGWLRSPSGPQHEKPNFRHFHSVGDEPALGLRLLQLNMLHPSLGLEPRTLFILQEPAAEVARHAEPQGMTSNSAITTTGNVNSVRSRLLRRGVARAGRERH